MSSDYLTLAVFVIFCTFNDCDWKNDIAYSRLAFTERILGTILSK